MNSIIQIVENYLYRTKKPTHYDVLTKVVLKQKALKTATPSESVRSLIALSSKFDSYGRGLYGLRKWGLKWYKYFYKRGYYLSLGDIICNILDEKSVPTRFDDMVCEINKLYSGRYKSLDLQIRETYQKDRRIIKQGGYLTLRNFCVDDFSPNNIKANMNQSYKFLKEIGRPISYRTILSVVNFVDTDDLSSGDVLIISLYLDKRFVKLGPKGNYGLKEWVS